MELDARSEAADELMTDAPPEAPDSWLSSFHEWMSKNPRLDLQNLAGYAGALVVSCG